MDYLQKWWEEKYPGAGVKKVKNVSEGVLGIADLIDFEKWLIKNFKLNKRSKCQIKINNVTELVKKVFLELEVNYGFTTRRWSPDDFEYATDIINATITVVEKACSTINNKNL